MTHPVTRHREEIEEIDLKWTWPTLQTLRPIEACTEACTEACAGLFSPELRPA